MSTFKDIISNIHVFLHIKKIVIISDCFFLSFFFFGMQIYMLVDINYGDDQENSLAA